MKYWYRLACAVALSTLAACGQRPAEQPAASPPQRTPVAAPVPPPIGGVPTEQLEHIVTLTNRGVALMDQFKPVAAAATFEEVTQRAPGWMPGHLNLAIALLNTEDEEQFPRAQAEFNRVLAAEPDHPTAHYALGMLLRHLGQFDEAQGHFARVTEIDPGDADAHYQFGALLADTDPDAAREHFERALALTPHHASASYRLFTLLAQTGDSEAARDVLATFQELKRTESGVTLAMQYGEMGRYASVIDVFDGAAAASPGEQTIPSFADVAGAVGLTGTNAGIPGRPGDAWDGAAETAAQAFGPGAAVADVDGDGDLDIYIPPLEPGGGGLYLNEDGHFSPAGNAGIDGTHVIAGYFADFDRDGDADLYVTCAGPNRLYTNDGSGAFTNVTAETGTGGGNVLSLGAAWADADHDGDLDLYVANYCALPRAEGDTAGTPNTLWRNNGDGTFTDTAAEAGIDGGDARSAGVLFFDADGDRDADLYVVNDGERNRLFINDRIGRYHDATETHAALADAGPGLGVLVGDVNLDGREDLVLLRGAGPPRVLLRDSDSGFTAGPAVAGAGAAVSGALADVDLDGDLDLVLVGADTAVHLNDGTGRFAAGVPLGDTGASLTARGMAAADFDGDGALEILVAHAGAAPQLWRGDVPAGRHWLEVAPRVQQGADGRPTPSGIGLHVEVKTGRRLQVATIASSAGYLGGPPARAHFGLGEHAKADYVRLRWPDATLQSEIEVPADQTWRIAQMKRKPSSCPVLFAWNGKRFEFVTDFLGVGGLGAFQAPGVYGQPDPTEAVRIPPAAIREANGKYLIRVTEPLEEVVYLDALHLEVYDHPADWEVYPDERMAGAAPWPTGEPLVVQRKLFPVAARTDRKAPVLERLLAIDRSYAEPRLDPWLVGYAEDHWLELDFGQQLAEIPDDARVILYLYSWVEYSYSHTNYAAYQAGMAMHPPSIEVPDGAGGWRVAMPYVGFPAGLPRMMTVDVSALPLRRDGRLRLRTTMEVFYDQVFIGVVPKPADLRTHTLQPSVAGLRYLGYPREYSPDGNVPTIYDYHRLDQGVPFKNMTGAYTRMGDVRELLARVDDRFVIMGRGEEIALEFDAASLPPLPPGWARTLVLHTDGYCKDMDLYTAEGDTVGPLPYHAMKTYPPSAPFPDADDYRRTWNTRWIAGR